MVLGVGAGIGFGFGGTTCLGGVADLEEPGLFVLAAFWSFASRFSRIYPSPLNIFHEIRCGLFTLSASSWGVGPSWFGFGSELMVVVEIIGVRPLEERGSQGVYPPDAVTSTTRPPPNAPPLHLDDLPAECGGRFPFQLTVVRDLVRALVSQAEITFRDKEEVEKSPERTFQTREFLSPCFAAATPNPEREFQGKAGHSHLNTSKSPARKNRLSQTAYSEGRQTVNLKKLLPYG